MTSLKVKILKTGQIAERQMELEDGLTYQDLFEILEINPETAVALRKRVPQPVDDVIEPDEIEIVHVVSSG